MWHYLVLVRYLAVSLHGFVDCLDVLLRCVNGLKISLPSLVWTRCIRSHLRVWLAGWHTVYGNVLYSRKTPFFLDLTTFSALGTREAEMRKEDWVGLALVYCGVPCNFTHRRGSVSCEWSSSFPVGEAFTVRKQPSCISHRDSKLTSHSLHSSSAVHQALSLPVPLHAL